MNIHLLFFYLFLISFLCIASYASCATYNDAISGNVSQDKIHDVKETIDLKRQNTQKKIKELKLKETREINKLYKSQGNLEVTKKEGQAKNDYLRGIIEHGSERAKILKCADRISNMTSLGFVTDPAFIQRYCDETEYFIFPIALEVDYNMYQELISLVITRRQYLEDSGYLDKKK